MSRPKRVASRFRGLDSQWYVVLGTARCVLAGPYELRRHASYVKGQFQEIFDTEAKP